MIIPRVVDGDEILIRGIVTPLFYSNSGRRLKREAFLPPPNKNDVSLLRLKFTTYNFCKRHSKSLNITSQTYCGLACFIANQIQAIIGSGNYPFTVTVHGTPLNENMQIIPEENEVQHDDPRGLPMHADMLYSAALTKGEVQTQHRKFADELLKLAVYLHDPSPQEDKWSGQIYQHYNNS